MEFNNIPSERLLLREMNPETYRFVFSSYTTEQLMAFFGFTSAADLEQKKRNHENGLTMFNKSFLYFQLLDKDTQQFLGWCGYHTWYLPHFRAEIGYGLTHERDRGKGYMREAFPPILRYGFEKMKLNRIEAFIGHHNIPSTKLVQRYGFTREGILREHYCKDGVIEDSVVYSLLRKEFMQ